jgi:hypothetical protein
MRVAITVHCGLPLGTPSMRLGQAIDGPLSSLFDALQTRPRLKVGLHLGGHILDFLLRHRSQRLVQLVGLAQGGQVELVGGGYYDPILCALSRRSAKAQLKRTAQFFEEQLCLKASGAWLPEQIFEPAMVELLAGAGYRYVILPRDPIDAGGLESAKLQGPVRLEQGGAKLLGLVAEQGQESARVRSLSPWIELAEKGCKLLVWNADLLRLSSDLQNWPKGAQIERFLGDLDAQSQLEFWLPKEIAETPQERLIYPGPGSHREMGTWSLPVHAARRRARILESTAQKGGKEGLPLLAGGRWASFLARYPEAGRMHNRALQLASRIDASQLPSYWHERMWTSLLQSQGHEAFQHGDRSGIYNPVLRQAVHGRLRDLEDYLDHLEAAADGDPKRLNAMRSETVELMPDGTKGVVLSGTRGHWTLCPERGGALVGLEVPGTPWDLVHTMPRYPERYDDLGLEEHPKWSLCDRFISSSDNLDAPVYTGDFSAKEYHVNHLDNGCELSAEGSVSGVLGVRVIKRFELAHSGAELQVQLSVQTPENHALRGFLLHKIYLSLPPGQGNKQRLGDQVSDWDEPLRGDAASIQFAAPSNRLQFSVVLPGVMPIWTKPLYAEHQDCGVTRSSLQGIEIGAAIPLQLSSGARWSGQIILRALRR